MASMIKVIILIKFIVVLLLLQQTNGFRNSMQIRKYGYPREVPVIARDGIIMKWMNAETALRGVYIALIKSLLPTAYGMSGPSKVSHNCTLSLFEYLNGLRNMKSWAYRMLDATGKLPNGMFGGNPMSFGDYDTCLEVESPSRKFQGQYCYVEMNVPLPKRKIMTPVEAPVEGVYGIFEPESTFEYLSSVAGFLYNSQLRYTTCLPSTCTGEDVKVIFNNVVAYIESSTQVSVPHCETKEALEYTALEILIYVIFSCLICLVVLGTSVELLIRSNNYETEKLSKTVQALVCFSAYSNCSRLLREDNNPDVLHTFHGLRVLSMAWIMWSHSYNVVNFKAYDGTFYTMDIRKELFFQIAPTGFLAVENFFFMSSVLLSYVCVRMRGKINMPLIFLKRYLRLTPTLMLVVAFFSIVGRFGSGPLWKETIIEGLSKNCRERGWMNLFYLNNYLYSEKICLGWTWYLSTDTQMFLFCLYICVVLRRRPGRGLLLAGLFLIAGVLATIFSVFYYELPPTFLQSFVNFEDWYYYAIKGYTQAHVHLSVSAVGLFTGYILATKKGHHIPKHINAMGWILCIITFCSIVGLTCKWNQGYQGHPSPFVSALYASFHRLAWSLCLGFVTISCTWGQGGFVNSFLSWKGFVPFARLTYMVYLLHYGFIHIYTGLVRQTMNFGHRSLSFIFLNNLFLSFLAAFVLGLFFEAPLLALEKTFSDGKLRKQVQPVSAANGTAIIKNAA